VEHRQSVTNTPVRAVYIHGYQTSTNGTGDYCTYLLGGCCWLQ